MLDKLWSKDLNFFVTLTVPKPPAHGAGGAAAAAAAAAGGVVAAAAPAFAFAQPPPPNSPGAQCPTKGPPRWPVGKQVTVREIMGLSSPWYFGVPPKDASFTKYVQVCLRALARQRSALPPRRAALCPPHTHTHTHTHTRARARSILPRDSLGGELCAGSIGRGIFVLKLSF